MTTLAKALKEKNKLKLEIAQLQKRLTTHNSVVKGNVRPFDLNQLNNELCEKITQIIALKAAITKANQPVQDKIYRLAELKGLISFYNKLPSTDGKSVPSFREESTEYESFFNEAKIAEMVKKLELETEIIQDTLEAFNQSTKI